MAKASDNAFPSILLVEQASAPTTPSSGQARLYRKTDNKLYIRDDGGTETEVGGGTATETWSSWSPTLTATTTNPTLGTGSTTAGRYCDTGGTIMGWACFIFGTSGTNAGSGTYVINLPVPMRAANFSGGVPLHGAVGIARMRDASASAEFGGIVVPRDANSLGIVADAATSAAPFAWTVSDRLYVSFEYEPEP